MTLTKTENIMETKIPTNRGENCKTIYAYEGLIKKLATYEQSLEAHNQVNTEEVEYYWYDNRAWNKNEPIGIMTKEDAFDRQSKGIAFIDFETTIPAITKNQYDKFKMESYVETIIRDWDYYTDHIKEISFEQYMRDRFKNLFEKNTGQ